MRIEILLIYNIYKNEKAIPLEIFTSYCEIYEEYINANGNTYVKEIIDPEIRSWKIIEN